MADDPTLRAYLELRADALLTDDYRASELAWLDMKDAAIDLIIGPVEEYEDALFGRKAAHEGILLLKDRDRSARFDRVASLLPELQAGLPVPDAYKLEIPSLDGGIGVFDAVAYAGDASAMTPDAITLPNDEDLQLEKGTRRLQLRNAMRVGFDLSTTAVAAGVIAAEQRGHVEFQAYFAFVMCHEIAHGLGVKRTLDRGLPVRDALLDQHAAVEEGKADVVGLHMLARLIDLGRARRHQPRELLRDLRERADPPDPQGVGVGLSRANLANLDVLLGAARSRATTPRGRTRWMSAGCATRSMLSQGDTFACRETATTPARRPSSRRRSTSRPPCRPTSIGWGDGHSECDQVPTGDRDDGMTARPASQVLVLGVPLALGGWIPELEAAIIGMTKTPDGLRRHGSP